MSVNDLIPELTQNNDKESFLLNVRSALIKTANYLKSNLPFTDQFFSLDCLITPNVVVCMQLQELLAI